MIVYGCGSLVSMMVGGCGGFYFLEKDGPGALWNQGGSGGLPEEPWLQVHLKISSVVNPPGSVSCSGWD